MFVFPFILLAPRNLPSTAFVPTHSRHPALLAACAGATCILRNCTTCQLIRFWCLTGLQAFGCVKICSSLPMLDVFSLNLRFPFIEICAPGAGLPFLARHGHLPLRWALEEEVIVVSNSQIRIILLEPQNRIFSTWTTPRAFFQQRNGIIRPLTCFFRPRNMIVSNWGPLARFFDTCTGLDQCVKNRGEVVAP